ncbi:MAG: hypothetical protein ACRD15_17775 [Vicinamibacterales bacterium]
MIDLVIGRREQGKTTLAVYMASKVPARMIFDPRGMIRRPGAVIVHTAEDLRSAMDALAEGEIAEVVYAPHEDDLEEAFRAFSEELRLWIIERPRQKLAALVDEISFVSLDVPAFEWACKCSLRDRIHIIMTCHRPADVPVPVRTIADTWMLFPCRQEHDLDTIKRRCSPAVADKVAKLHDRQFVVWDDTNASSRVYDDPSGWFLRLS